MSNADKLAGCLEKVLSTGLNGGNNVRLAFIAASQQSLKDDALSQADASEAAVKEARQALASYRASKDVADDVIHIGTISDDDGPNDHVIEHFIKKKLKQRNSNENIPQTVADDELIHRIEKELAVWKAEYLELKKFDECAVYETPLVEIMQDTIARLQAAPNPWIKGKDFDFEKHEGRLVAFLSLWPVGETKRLQVGMVGFDPAGGGCINGEGFCYGQYDVIKIHLLPPLD